MPFQSEAQRRYLWMHHPEIAKKWAAEYPDQGKLPMHATEKVTRALMEARHARSR